MTNEPALTLQVPVVLPETAGLRQHWGLIEIGLDQTALLAQAGMPTAAERLQLVLRDDRGRALAGLAELSSAAQAERHIVLPGGGWTLAGRAHLPADTVPWQLLLGMVCAALGGMLTWRLRSGQLDARQLALHDHLTGLPNRRLLQDRMQQACALAVRSGKRVVLLYLDLDNFKPVNDNHGHQAGDIVLREVAQRLRSCVRRSDTVARVSGDEFVLVLEDLVTAREAEAVADKVLSIFAQPITADDHAFRLGCSIGLVPLGRQCDVDEALAQADAAMYQAKREGKNAYRWYTPGPLQHTATEIPTTAGIT